MTNTITHDHMLPHDEEVNGSDAMSPQQFAFGIIASPPDPFKFSKRETVLLLAMVGATIMMTMKIRSEHRQMMRMLDLAQTAILEFETHNAIHGS